MEKSCSYRIQLLSLQGHSAKPSAAPTLLHIVNASACRLSTLSATCVRITLLCITCDIIKLRKLYTYAMALLQHATQSKAQVPSLKPTGSHVNKQPSTFGRNIEMGTATQLPASSALFLPRQLQWVTESGYINHCPCSHARPMPPRHSLLCYKRV